MKFTARKRRQPPAVIIISLIDILIVLLIFLMVTTTFKQFPTVKLALPESKQPKQGTANPEQLIVTVAIRPDKEAPVGEFMKVIEAANAAKIKTSVNVFVKPAGP